MNNHLKTLNSFVDQLIRDNKTVTPEGYSLSVDDLHRLEKEEFAACIIACDSDKKAGWEWLAYDPCEHELANLFASFISSYGNKQIELRDNFIDRLKASAVQSLRGRMQDIIDNRISDVWFEDDYELKHPADDWDYQEVHA